MYADLLDHAADDLDRGGVTRQVLAGHEDDPGPSALALRLAGSVHRLVLERRAGELAAYYPSVGGSWRPDGGWAALQAVLRDQSDAVREWLDPPPQTNEVGRAGALMGGLLRLGETFTHPVRLFEIGASGGLNLNVNAFGYTDQDDQVFGDRASPLLLRGAWRGRALRPWPGLDIVERVGSDLMPVDVSSTEGRLTLTSYVWPDQTERHERLRCAFTVAAENPVEVRRQDAVSFLNNLELVAGTTTVLWHSVMWQYLTAADQADVRARIDALGASAGRDTPFVHLYAEPTRRWPGSDHEFLVVSELWPTGGRRILGSTAAHGLPTTWE